MATFNQAMRSLAAAQRRAEREKQRRAREVARLYKEQQKQQEISNAYETVRRYEDYIDVLMSIHKSSTDRIDWERIKNEPEPVKPIKQDIHESDAKLNLDNFKPTNLGKLFGSNKKKIKILEDKIDIAKKNDEDEYQQLLKEYENQHEEWEIVQRIAKGVLNKEPESYKDTIEFFQPFNDIKAIGSNLNIKFNKDFIEIDLNVNSSEVIPNYIVSQTKAGKLSKKDMPKGRFNELYQDYVCGCVLRVARESLAYLPIKMVTIHAMSELLNSKTGHLEEVPILSAAFPPETIDKLNFETLDQSDSMENFIHSMKFTKTNGFSKVDKVDTKRYINNN